MAQNNAKNIPDEPKDTQISPPTATVVKMGKQNEKHVSKRKVNDSLSPEKEKIYQSLMTNLSPDNSIIVYTDHKKRVVGPSHNEGTQSELPQSSPGVSRQTQQSDGYDSKDNRPLSQLTQQTPTHSQVGGDSPENNLVYTPQLGGPRLPPLQRRLLKAKSVTQAQLVLTDPGTDSEVDVAKTEDKIPDYLMGVLKDIQDKIANLTVQKEKSEKDISQINQNLEAISQNIVLRPELEAAIGKVSDHYMKDKIKLNQTLQEHNTRLDLIGSELKEVVDAQQEKIKSLDLSINDTKLLHIMDMDKISEKISQLETEVKVLRDVKTQNPIENVNKERDTKKSIITEGLNECAHEDIYAAVISTIKQIGLNIFENDIDLTYWIGSFKGFNIWPRPVRVTFVSERVKLHIMENRECMKNSTTHYNVRLVKDEPKDVRVSRAILRKGAAKARDMGSHVVEKHDAVQIDGTLYNLQNAHILEKSYKDALLSTSASQAGKKSVTGRGRTKVPLPCERTSEKWLAF